MNESGLEYLSRICVICKKTNRECEKILIKCTICNNMSRDCDNMKCSSCSYQVCDYCLGHVADLTTNCRVCKKDFCMKCKWYGKTNPDGTRIIDDFEGEVFCEECFYNYYPDVKKHIHNLKNENQQLKTYIYNSKLEPYLIPVLANIVTKYLN